MGSTCLQIPINQNDISLWDQVSISKQEKYAQLRIQQKFSEPSSCPDEHVQITSHSNDENNNSQDEISIPQVDQSPAKTCKSILKNKNEFQIIDYTIQQLEQNCVIQFHTSRLIKLNDEIQRKTVRRIKKISGILI